MSEQALAVGLVVFDVDGTLTDTTEVDADCFVGAMADTFGIEEVDTDWSQYTSCTDAAILEDLVRDRLGWEVSAEERTSFIAAVAARLERVQITAPHRYRPIAGARETLERLRQDPTWDVAVATGAWGESAQRKLRYSGVAAEDLPFASSSDSPSRDEVVRLAIERARKIYGRQGYNRLVAVGDGIWDVWTARSLGLGFVGVGRGQAAAKLRAEGATLVLPDLSDAPEVIRCLAEALVPISSARACRV